MIGGRRGLEDAAVTWDRYYPNMRSLSNISRRGLIGHKVRGWSRGLKFEIHERRTDVGLPGGQNVKSGSELHA